VTAPLPGPLAAAPEVAAETARAMLDDVLDDLPMGVWDTEVRTWVELADPAYVATVASWCRRSWAAGVDTGRAERAAEVAEYADAVQRARASLDDLTGRRPDGA